MRITKHILSLLLAIIACQSYAQSTFTNRAYEFYKSNDYINAKATIDSAVISDERFDTQTWQLRGIIYRNMETTENDGFREIALESFVQAKEIDKQGIFEEKIKSYIENTIIRYYNDAVTLMNEDHNLEESEKFYLKYKEYYLKYLNPSISFDDQDIIYYNALGSDYLEKTATVGMEEKEIIRKKAIEKLNQVIKIDPTNFSANLNCGAIFYTLAVDYTMNLDAESTIDDIIANQKKSEDNFLEALPYLHNAEKNEPDNIEVIKALTGCYYGLNNNDAYLKYQTILDKRELKSILEQHESNPEDRDLLKQLVRIYSSTILDIEKENHFRELLRQSQN